MSKIFLQIGCDFYESFLFNFPSQRYYSFSKYHIFVKLFFFIQAEIVESIEFIIFLFIFRLNVV